MDKLEIAAEVGRLEAELAKVEAELREHERKFTSAKGNRTAGAAAVLVGILAFVFLNLLWPLWASLGLIGLPTLVTAISKQRGAKTAMREAEDRISEVRGRLAELRAQLALL